MLPLSDMKDTGELQTIIENIAEKANFKNKDNFKTFLGKCIQISKDTGKSTYAVHENIVFKLNSFFKEFGPFKYEFGKDHFYEAGVEAFYTIFEELGLDLGKEDCFLLYHFRDAGKFRLKESNVLDEMKALWKKYPHYELEGNDFSYSLKDLMRAKLIDYRRGNMYIKPSMIIRYRTNI